MSAPIPVAWPLIVLVVLALCVCCYGLGGDHQRRDDAWQIGYVLRENRHLATCVRFLFAAGELLMPEMEPEPEPGPTVRQRITARLVNTVGWVRARFRGPAEVEATPEFVEERYDLDDVAREFGVDLAESDSGADTDEMPALPGPVTQPSAVVIDDQWQRDSEALYQQMLAEIRGETVKEGS